MPPPGPPKTAEDPAGQFTDRAAARASEQGLAVVRRAERDAQYRAALGLDDGQPLPAQLGSVGGSRGGRGARINQTTDGRPAPWHTEARRAAARRWIQTEDGD